MTREDVLSMIPGHALDELMTITMFGSKYDGTLPMPFSTDMNCSWQAFESLPPAMFGHEISLGRVGQEWGVYYEAGAGREMFVALAATAPLAICRAKLLLSLEDEK
jgi:hypothetical protein